MNALWIVAIVLGSIISYAVIGWIFTLVLSYVCEFTTDSTCWWDIWYQEDWAEGPGIGLTWPFLVVLTLIRTFTYVPIKGMYGSGIAARGPQQIGKELANKRKQKA